MTFKNWLLRFSLQNRLIYPLYETYCGILSIAVVCFIRMDPVHITTSHAACMIREAESGNAVKHPISLLQN